MMNQCFVAIWPVISIRIIRNFQSPVETIQEAKLTLKLNFVDAAIIDYNLHDGYGEEVLPSTAARLCNDRNVSTISARGHSGKI